MCCCTLPTIVQTFGEIPSKRLEEHKLELAAELIRSASKIRIKALGTSMLPTIWPGDILQIESTASDQLAVGDVVLVKRAKSIVIHRLMKNDGPQWVTRGDAMPQDDPPVTAADVLGRVALIERRNRATEPRRRVTLIQRALAWVLCRWQICRNVALRARASRREPGLHGIEKMSLEQGRSQTN